MKYNHDTGRGVMDYADVRKVAEEALALLQQIDMTKVQESLDWSVDKRLDEARTALEHSTNQLMRIETLLLRIIGSTPV